MCNSLLLPLIKRFKKQDMSVFESIYEQFSKLITFYAAHIGSEDACSELTLFLIELLYAIDLSSFAEDCSQGLKKYIAVCLRNQYILISRNQQKQKNLTVTLYENVNPCYEFQDDRITVEQILKYLTEKQRLVLIYKYKYGYSDCEIAKKLKIKRQAVNQLKNRAFKILKTKL